MKQDGRAIIVLMADDDEDDRMLVKEAFVENRLEADLHFVSDGEELMEYLKMGNSSSDSAAPPLPGIILLDLNMPRKDGREVLREIKADPGLRRIPVVVLTTSEGPEDVANSYRWGASSFITKPSTFDDLLQVVRSFGRYWLDIVELPLDECGCKDRKTTSGGHPRGC